MKLILNGLAFIAGLLAIASLVGVLCYSVAKALEPLMQ